MNQTLRIFAAVSITACLFGCASTVKTDPSKMNKVELSKASQQDLLKETAVGGIPVQVDMQAEEVVSTECLKAWRKAVKGDEKTAMAELKDLEKRYPKISTIKLMMGQVAEHAGNKEDAIKYYAAALEDSEFSSIRVFKLAEALRKAGKFQEAIPHYRRLMKVSSDFMYAKLGLGACLLAIDKKSAEGATLIKETVKLASEELSSKQPKTVSEAKAILTEVLVADPGNKEARRLLGR